MSNTVGDISEKELVNCIAFESGDLSIESTEKFLYALKKVILKQLQLNHRIRFIGFGVFEDYVREAHTQVIGSFLGGTQTIYVNPKTFIKFKPAKTFLGEINDDYRMKYTVTKKKAKRNKNQSKIYKKRIAQKNEPSFDYLMGKALEKKKKKLEDNE